MATKPTANKTPPKGNESGKESVLQKPAQPSKDLAAVIGSEHRSRGEAGVGLHQDA